MSRKSHYKRKRSYERIQSLANVRHIGYILTINTFLAILSLKDHLMHSHFTKFYVALIDVLPQDLVVNCKLLSCFK